MRKPHRISAWLTAGAATIALGYAVYAEAGGPPQEAAARRRACMLCHALPEAPLECQRNQAPGEPLTPLLEERLRQVHPLLTQGATKELAHILAQRQLPALAQQRAGAPGEALYIAKCAACHGKHGEGQEDEYPPLMGSEWLTPPPDRLQEILTQGLQEPITVRGKAWNKTMRAPGLTTPQEVKQVIDYLRSVFAR